MSQAQRITLFDTTLRDGAQTHGVDFSVADKTALALALDDLGLDYVEGGWPGANPTDDRFFSEAPALKHSVFTAFGMTKKAGRSAANDPSLSTVLNSGAKAFCLVGKTWDFHVDIALGISHEENLENIRESLKEAAKRGEALFDAEHFFDGYKANPGYALQCLQAALDGGARWIVLCDTNGGALPHEVTAIVTEAARVVAPERLGIHTHDDTGNAVANSIAAVLAGCRMVQGTLNGLGERCGNANLISLIPTLMLKMGYDVGLKTDDLKKLKSLSRLLDEMLNRGANTGAPYVGERAFVHKGGLHASAVQKDASSYEHIDPALVGNNRLVVVSDQAGRANIVNRLQEMGLKVDPSDPRVQGLVDQVKQAEYEGYAYDTAEASFRLMAQRALGQVKDRFQMEKFAVSYEHRYHVQGELMTQSEATVRLNIGGQSIHTVADGNGPVNALDQALRKALEPTYPSLRNMQLTDYRVRILMPQDASAAKPRVRIESALIDDPKENWATIGVSTNIIEASYIALQDSYIYYLSRYGS